MNNRAETRHDPRASVQDTGTAPKNGFFGAVRAKFLDIADTVRRRFGIRDENARKHDLHSPVETRGHMIPAAVITAGKTLAAGAALFLLGWLFAAAAFGRGAGMGIGAGETRPLGLALLCAAEQYLPAAFLGCICSAARLGKEGGLYLGAMLLAVGTRYAVGRFLTPEAEAEPKPDISAADAGAGTGTGTGKYIRTAARFRRALLPPGVFAQTVAVRVGISLAAAAVTVLGWMLGDGMGMGTSASVDDTVNAVLKALFFLCAVPAFTYAFCGIFTKSGDSTGEDAPADGRRPVSPALREGGIGAFCYALTASLGGVFLFGLSAKLICAQILTLYLSKKGGFLRGSAAGLCAGLACDVLYAPAYAVIGAVSGVLWQLHPAPAVVLSLCAGAAYAVYAGAFAAVRSVVPEMIVSAAAAYPLFRYLPVGRTVLPDGTDTPARDRNKQTKKPKRKRFSDLFDGTDCTECGEYTDCAACTEAPAADTDVTEKEQTAIPQEILGLPDPAEQMDALSGILGGLSAAFYHLSDRGRKPGLFEIRQLCESTADRYCAHCPHHELCWEEDFSATADAMGKITLCVHRKGRAEVSHAFAPLDTRCPSLPSMLAAISEAAAVLCEEKMTKDKMEIAAADYEGMAKLLRAHAEETARAREEDTVLSKRLAGVMGRLGFRAEHLAVYGPRRQTVAASGIVPASGLRPAAGAENDGISGAGRRGGIPPLLGTEDLRAAFSAAAGVMYRAPDYTITDGGKRLYMTLHAEPQLTVDCGWWGEKKPGEEVTGDALTVFSDRNDDFYALLCDGMGSGKEASVTAQIASLFLEKLLSVSSAKGAALNLLNTFLRSRGSECSVTVDLCEIDLLTSEAHFLKCGASPSYLIRGEHLFRIASGTMPLGILREVTAEETSFPLENGDLLLFFSDGVCGDEEDARWILKTALAAVARAEQEERWEGTPDEGAPHAADGTGQSEKTGNTDGTDKTGQTEEKGGGEAEDGGTVSFTPAAHGRECRTLFRAAELLGEAAKERNSRRDDMTAAILRVRRKGVI